MLDRVNKNLRRLSDGERLWLARRRTGLPQDAAARAADLGEKAYAAAEADRAPFPGRVAALRPTLPERLALARRRAGIGLAGLAKAVKATRVTVLAMERRGDAGLVAFWEKRGFRF